MIKLNDGGRPITKGEDANAALSSDALSSLLVLALP